MNAWNSDFVKKLYPSQALGYLHHLQDGRVNLNPTKLAHAIKALVKETKVDPNAPETRREAQRIMSEQKDADPPSPFPPQPDYGYVGQWLSEIGDPETLEGYLRHTDQFLNPTWERGGLFYPRNDRQQDDEGNWTLVDPFTGNAAIAHARLNVHDGHKTMWEKPWTSDHFSNYPYVDGVDLGSNVDFLRGAWDDRRGLMALTCRAWDGSDRRYGIYSFCFMRTHSITESLPYSVICPVVFTART